MSPFALFPLPDGSFAAAWEDIDGWSGVRGGIVLQRLDAYGRRAGDALLLPDITLRAPRFGNGETLFVLREDGTPARMAVSFIEMTPAILSDPIELDPNAAAWAGVGFDAACSSVSCAAVWMTCRESSFSVSMWVGR